MSSVADWQKDELWDGEREEFGIDHGEPEWQPFPEGFFKAITASGHSAGYGFSCWRCKFSIPYDAPAEVKHCGTVSVLDPNADMPVHKLGSWTHYRVLTEDQKAVLKIMSDAQPQPIEHADLLEPTPTLFERAWNRIVTLCRR